MVPVNTRCRRTVTHRWDWGSMQKANRFQASKDLAFEISEIIKAEFEIVQIIPVAHCKIKVQSIDIFEEEFLVSAVFILKELPIQNLR
jgi:hypothetical protein